MPIGFDCCGNHQRHGGADFAAEILNREDAGFDVARVLTGFEEKHIRAAFDEAASLLEIIFVELRECHAAGYADGLRRGAHRACHEARFRAFRELAHRLRGELGGAAADFSGAIAETILGENERRAAECICLDDVGAGFEVFAVNPENDIGSRDVEIFVAAFEVGAPEIRGGQILLLQHGAHRAIQHEDALAEKFAKGEALLNQVLHVANSIFSWVQRNKGVV